MLQSIILYTLFVLEHISVFGTVIGKDEVTGSIPVSSSKGSDSSVFTGDKGFFNAMIIICDS